jgi:hypothetical protein
MIDRVIVRRFVFSMSLVLWASLAYADAQIIPSTRLPAKKSKAGKPVEPVDWSRMANEELKKSSTGNARSAKGQGQEAFGELPTPATVVVVANPHQSLIEKTALRMGLTLEPYQPKGQGTFGVQETLQYETLPSSFMGNVDLRWLPFETSQDGSVRLGGYVGFGYSRQSVPLVTPTGFRYEDVALNSMRVEASGAFGYSLSERWNLDGRVGIGRQLLVQTSRYAEVVGNFDQFFVVGSLEVQYHIFPKLALMASMAHRSSIGSGSGSIGFDPLTVSGGVLVQVR